jgi:hypothetical protein
MLWLGSLWWGTAREAIELMLNTEYPGHRRVMGGDMPFEVVFHGVFESWRLEDFPVPFPPTNPTAASQMWVLFPLAALAIPVRRWLDSGNRESLALVAYSLFVLGWTTVPLPDPVRSLMAQAGWSMAPEWNSLFGMGVASALLMCVLVAGAARQDLTPGRWPSVWRVGAVCGAVIWLGLRLHQMDGGFFSAPRVLLGAAAVGGLAWAVLRGHRALFLVLVVLFSLPSMRVNPLQNGFQSYLGKGLFQSAAAVGGREDNAWAVFGDFRLAQGFKSVGLTVVNGTHYAPRLDMLRVLDPASQANDIWNRYAHIEMASGVRGEAPSFELMFPDHYRIRVDVCGPHLKKLGVSHVAYTYAPSPEELQCLEPAEPLRTVASVGLYRLRSATGP